MYKILDEIGTSAIYKDINFNDNVMISFSKCHKNVQFHFVIMFKWH